MNKSDLLSLLSEAQHQLSTWAPDCMEDEELVDVQSRISQALKEDEPGKEYIIQVVEDVEPVLHGPFKNYRGILEKGRSLRANDAELQDGLYYLRVGDGVVVDSFSGGVFDKK